MVKSLMLDGDLHPYPIATMVNVGDVTIPLNHCTTSHVTITFPIDIAVQNEGVAVVTRRYLRYKYSLQHKGKKRRQGFPFGKANWLADMYAKDKAMALKYLLNF